MDPPEGREIIPVRTPVKQKCLRFSGAYFFKDDLIVKPSCNK
jgi:hypothetical protein